MIEIRRETQLAQLREGKRFDLLVIGGGATGLGAAVDAARRGYRVALVERFDFAKGTSSRSTKLVHGGVRYLKQGNVKLVREALRERGRMLRNAHHLARNLEFVIPNYSWLDQAFYGVGMKVYDAMAGALGLGASQWLGRQETLEHLPTVVTTGLKGGVLYHDGQFDDARMAINLMQTAVELGAVAVNYCSCVRFMSDSSGKLTGAWVIDSETGAEFPVEAAAIINATGVFVDELRRLATPDAPAMVTPSQGIHVVLPRRFLPGNSALMVPKTADGRVLFAVPWHDAVIVGTTDTPVREATSEPRALPEEYAFVMSHAAKYLAPGPTDDDVLSLFAGLRPLVRTGTGERTASLSRDHTIVIGRDGLITITGGKWTTYRAMGEDVVNRMEEVAGFAHRPSRTVDFPIHGARGERPPVEERLAVYGDDAEPIAALEQTDAGNRERLHPSLPYTVGEVRWHARHEMAQTVEDVLARRTRALILNARASAVAAPRVAAVLAEEQGRGEAWGTAEIARFRELAGGYASLP